MLHVPLANLPCRHLEQLIWSCYLCRPINHSTVFPERQRGHNKVIRVLTGLMDHGGTHLTAAGAQR